MNYMRRVVSSKEKKRRLTTLAGNDLAGRLLAEYDDLTSLSLDLGFSSHSHFSSAFRTAYGRTPSEFKQFALRR